MLPTPPPPRPLTTPRPAHAALSRAFILAALLLLPLARAHATSPAEHALLTGHIADAEHLLREQIARDNQPADHLLLCRALYAEDRADDAVTECQIAADATPPPTDAFLWLGRVQGTRAARANPLAAFVLARKVHAAFLRAVELDPASAAAVADLGEYLVEAPAVVGGGLDQARALAQDAMPRVPSAAHHLLARVAQKSGDMPLAEQEFHAAINTAHGSAIAGAWIDLAQFLTERNRPADALAAIHAAIAADAAHDDVLVDATRLEARLHQPPSVAIPLLRRYLDSPNQTDAAPVFKVRLELARLLDQIGDTAGAERERALAHDLAPQFQPHDRPVRSADPDGQVR